MIQTIFYTNCPEPNSIFQAWVVYENKSCYKVIYEKNYIEVAKKFFSHITEAQQSAKRWVKQ